MEENTSGTMESESESWTDSVVPRNAMANMEGSLGDISRGIWQFVHGMPGHGAIPGFALGLGAATLFGVGELAVGVFTAYVGYRVFAYGESLTEAMEKAIKFEAGKLEEKEIGKPVPK